ncbi:MAG: enoyl-CoA hydratase-related protein [Acidimicrobiales bacterium]
MDLKVVRYATDDGVATITLERPERLNSWTGRMHAEYRWCLARAEADKAVRVIVVTGEGRAFCAGADTEALERNAETGRYDPGVAPDDLATPGFGVRPEYDHPFAYHFGVVKPIIAAINGAAAGVGLVLACFCDMRFAAAGAKLTTSAPRLGFPAEYGLSWVLPRLVGTGHAADLLFSSRVVLAEEAATMGLVNKVLPPEELMGFVAAYARRLATEVSPWAVAQAKRQLYADWHRDVGAAVAESEALIVEGAARPDYAEGVKAWLEKRTPRF